jgi:putative oxidoreductase
MMANGMSKIARTILRGVVSALFLFTAVLKFWHPHNFAQWGYSDSFAIFIGVAELCGAIGLWIPRLSRLAAVGLAIIMLGAAYTQMHAGEPRQGIVPVLVLFALTRLAMK